MKKQLSVSDSSCFQQTQTSGRSVDNTLRFPAYEMLELSSSARLCVWLSSHQVEDLHDRH